MDTMTKPKMDPALKTKWVEALRSGRYKQGQRFLHIKSTEGDLFCCLGVLCEVAIQEGLPLETQVKADAVVYGKFKHPCSAPQEVRHWGGQALVDALFTLVSLNDHHGKSFDEIADWIEENL